ncbi:MAG TPA: glycosyltransferase family 4 protein [Kiritimatiellia bacterium]|nr:glycosyltransferase family 4 protein [Kiritimatiellia bacterium]
MSPAPRLAFIAPRFSAGGTIGGAETLLKALAEQAVAHGCEVDFLTTCAENHFTWENTVPPGTQSHNGLTVHFFPVDDDRDVSRFLQVQQAIDARGPVSRADEEAWIANSVNSRALCQHLRDHGDRYDRILAGPYLFGITWHAAQIHPEKTYLVPCLHDEAFAYLSIMHDLFHGVAGFLFNTEPERQLALRLYNLPQSAGAIVGLGLEPFDADAHAFAKRHHIQTPYLIYCGRREPLKGTPLLTAYVHAFRERTGRDLMLVFTGSGEIDAPEELRPHILDVGFVSEQEKHEAMAGAIAFVHPSINESLGIVLLESWLVRTPALVHSHSAVLRDQCRRANAGLWFTHYPHFEESVLRLLDDPTLRSRLGEAGREFVLRDYAWPAVVARMFSALRLAP